MTALASNVGRGQIPSRPPSLFCSPEGPPLERLTSGGPCWTEWRQKARSTEKINRADSLGDPTGNARGRVRSPRGTEIGLRVQSSEFPLCSGLDLIEESSSALTRFDLNCFVRRASESCLSSHLTLPVEECSSLLLRKRDLSLLVVEIPREEEEHISENVSIFSSISFRRSFLVHPAPWVLLRLQRGMSHRRQFKRG